MSATTEIMHRIDKVNDLPINLSTTERTVSTVGGAVLMAAGLAQRSWPGWGLAAIGGMLLYRGLSGHCHLYKALGINQADHDNRAMGVRSHPGLKYETSLHILRTPEEVYRFWRDLRNLPRVMRNIDSVSVDTKGRSYWVARTPLGATVRWEAEVVKEKENEWLAWRSLPGSDVDIAGSVAFDPGPDGHGTMLTVSLRYDPPGGRMSAFIADLFEGGVERRMDNDLFRLKEALESENSTGLLGAEEAPHPISRRAR